MGVVRVLYAASFEAISMCILFLYRVVYLDPVDVEMFNSSTI